MTDKQPPERIWLLDYGHDECTWCDDPSPSGEDHSPVEYVRADLIERLTTQRDEAVAALRGMVEIAPIWESLDRRKHIQLNASTAYHAATAALAKLETK